MPERHRTAVKAVACVALLWAGCVDAGTSPAAVVELRGPQIRSEIGGRMVTDEHHWSHLYHADGRLERWEGKRHKGGRWQVKDNRLCLLMPEIDPKIPLCYRVFRQGQELEYRDDTSLAYRGTARAMPK